MNTHKIDNTTQPTGTPQRGDASAVVCVCWWVSEVRT